MTYDYSKPILYANAKEEQDAVDTGIKHKFNSCIKYPQLGMQKDATFSVDSNSYGKNIANAIPWPEVKAILFKPKLNLYL